MLQETFNIKSVLKTVGSYQTLWTGDLQLCNN